MTPAPMAGSFVLDDLAETIHQWLPPNKLFQSTLYLGARPNIIAGRERH